MPSMTIREVLNLGHGHLNAGRLADAESMYQQVLQARPGHPEAIHFLGHVALKRGQFQAAVDLMGRSVAAAPQVVPFLTNYGLALAAADRYAEAAEVQARAIAAQGERPAPGSFSNLGTSLMWLGRMSEAADAYRRELAAYPGDARAWSNLGAALSETGRVPEAIECYRRSVGLAPGDSLVHSNLLMLLHFDPASDADAIRAEHQAWAARHAAPPGAGAAPHGNDRTPGRRLRVGYVSPDLRTHVVGYSLLPILEHHDRRRFEIACYSDAPRPDDFTARLRALTDLWRDTWNLSHTQLAEQIRQDRIDVLVDLSLHMGNNRMLTFARKPAPVQVTYLGYAATTGLPAMDYRVSDVHMDPPGRPPDGPEELLRLPDCYWAYRPADAGRAMPVPPLPFLKNGFVTFGSFNNFRKVNGGVIAAWATVMRQLPDSRLVVLLRGGESNTHVLEAFEGHGVQRGRVRLLPRQAPADYFRVQGEVDISLDPFPYNGGITSLDALWMGAPFVTLAGDRAVGRAGLSLLTNLGLTELVAGDVREYVERTLSLAGDAGRLAAIRDSLRDRLRRSPLMDEVGFARQLEATFLTAWERWRERETAAS